MDVVTDLLQRARARGAAFAVSTLRAPWVLELDEPMPLGVHVALEGAVWVHVDGEEPVLLAPGDVALVAAGTVHRLSSEATVRRRAGTRVLGMAATQQYRVPGAPDTFDVPGDGDASRILCGAYTFEGDLCSQLLSVVPRLLVVRAGTGDDLASIVQLLVAETSADRPGRSLVLDRLLDVMLVRLLRVWFGARGGEAPLWYRALDDPDLGPALRVVHEAPGRRWTLPAWAREVGLSRATFARKFQAAVGVAPMTYLANWRMQLAIEQLRNTATPIGRIARELGYDSDAAFTAAFRRHHGTTPTAMRASLREPVARTA